MQGAKERIKMRGVNINETQCKCVKKDSIVDRIKNTCAGVDL